MLGTENLYTAEQTRALDHCAIHDHSIPGITLMSRAASAAFDTCWRPGPSPSACRCCVAPATTAATVS